MSGPTPIAPHNIEAEKSVIGSLLIDNAGLDRIASILDPGMFFGDRFGKIYTAIATVLKNGQPADLVSVKAELERHTLKNGDTYLEDVGGAAYVASLVDGVPRATNIVMYTEIVREEWVRRQLIKAATALIDGCYAKQDSAKALLTATDTRLTALATSARLSVGATSVRDAIPAWMENMERRVERKGQVSGFATGFASLDLYTRGWQRQHTIVLAADTSYGKSVFALQTALSIAKQGGRFVYYSFEMPKSDLLDRLVCLLSGVPLDKILWGNVRTDAEWSAIRSAKDFIENDLPIEINDGEGRSIADIRAECRAIKADRGLAAIGVDHFQLTEGEEGSDGRIQGLAANSRALQRLASELDITTFVVSQLTLSDAESHKEPQLHHLRECKSLGHEANTVVMLHPYKPSEARDDTSRVPIVPMKVLIRKQRGGRVGRITLNLEREYVRFVEAEEPAPAPREPKKATGAKSKSFTY